MLNHFTLCIDKMCLQILCLHRLIGLVGRVFTNGPGDLGSIPGRIIPKTLKMVLDTSLLNTQQYKVRIKAKLEQSRKRSSALPYTPTVVAIERVPSGCPRLRSPTIYVKIGFGIKKRTLFDIP